MKSRVVQVTLLVTVLFATLNVALSATTAGSRLRRVVDSHNSALKSTNEAFVSDKRRMLDAVRPVLEDMESLSNEVDWSGNDELLEMKAETKVY